MTLAYTLHMPFWSRVKLLFGFGLRVEVESDRIVSVKTYVEGERNDLRPLMRLR